MPLAFQSFLSRDCVVRPVDGLFLVFFRPSGQTHLLPIQSYALLQLLDGRSLAVEEIPAVLAAEYDIESDEPDVVPALERQLRELQAVGLVEAISR